METQRNDRLALYNTLSVEVSELENELLTKQREVETINMRINSLKSYLKTFDQPIIPAKPMKDKNIGFVPGIKPSVIEFILNSPFPLTNARLQKEFYVPDDQKGNFGSMLKTLRGNGQIAAIKYDGNNADTYYGNPSNVNLDDYIDDYKTDAMKKLRKPKRI